MLESPASGVPPTLSTTAHDAVTSMFANQTDWLIRNVSGTVHPAGWTHPANLSDLSDLSDLVLAGSHGVAIVRADPVAIDAGLDWLGTTGSADVLIWSAAENAGADIHLLARGCRDSFKPRWMWRTLEHPLPAPRVEVDIDLTAASERDRDALLLARNVPYVSPKQIGQILDIATDRQQPRRTWMVIARQRRRFVDSPVVGVGILHLTSDNGETVGGLYNLGVDPGWQGKGIGTALTIAICRIARDQGASRVALNATPSGERIYRQLDFAVAGDGQTWFLPGSVLRDRPSRASIAAAEAIARGEVDRLEPGIAGWERLPNGESSIGFAARFGQRATLQWLLDHEADPDIAPLWSMGFREEAIWAASEHRWLNMQRGPEARTPLHDAVCGNDPELVRMLLAAGADLTIRDSQWHGRPLEWANALGHPDLAAMIQQAMSRS